MESWTEEYWDIQRRAFWGIRRYFARRVTPLCETCSLSKPDPGKHSFAQFDKRLRKEEVFLNDILNLLMRLAPQDLYRRIVRQLFAHDFPSGEYLESLGGTYVEHFGVGASTTQPDFFAVGAASTLAIELKLSSKTDIRQVLLYLALANIHDRKVGREHQHYLVLLTPSRPFDQVWAERFPDINTMKKALVHAAMEPSKHVPKQAHLFEALDLISIIPRFGVAHLTYIELAFILEALRPAQILTSADEVLEKLLTGAAAELRRFEQR